MAKTALITGASSGLGAEFVQLFAADGYDLILVARNEQVMNEQARSLSRKYGIRVLVLPCDLSQRDAAAAVYNSIREHKMRVDVLVNNAGFGDFGEFAECDWDRQYDMIQVNIVALLQLTRLLVGQMKRRGSGRILNVASTAAFQPGPLMSCYYASKAFVLSFSQALACELKGSGITVSVLCPGPTKTGFEQNASLGSSRLFKSLTVASAKSVARYGYAKLMSGQRIAVHGALNRALVTASRIAPRGLVCDVIRLIQGERRKSHL